MTNTGPVFEYRAVAGDLGSTPDELYLGADLEKAQTELRAAMNESEFPYDYGHIEFREIGAWNHISNLPGVPS